MTARDPASPFVSVKGAAAILGITERRAYDLLRVKDQRTGRPLIPHERQGDSYILHRSELERYREQGRIDPWGAEAPDPDAALPVDRVAEAVFERLVDLLLGARRGGRR